MKYNYIEVKINTTHKPPYFIGSMIRGSMGYALKKVTCINPSYKCEGCFAQESCLYYNFYEKPNTFHPFRFDVMLDSKGYGFGLYLFNEATKELSYVLSALHMMLTQNGLGKEQYTFENIEILVDATKVYDKEGFKSFDVEPKVFKLDSYCPNVKLRLLTPLRIKKANKLLREELELEDMLRSVYQREQELNSREKVYRLPYTPKKETTLKLLQYKQLKRKSNRQKQTLSIDGLIGEMLITGIDEQSYHLLKLGELIGVGKQTVMGLGKIEVINTRV